MDTIRRFYPDSILVAGHGENQDTEDKRLDFIGLGVEFKSPTGNYRVSDAQKRDEKAVR